MSNKHSLEDISDLQLGREIHPIDEKNVSIDFRSVSDLQKFLNLSPVERKSVDDYIMNNADKPDFWDENAAKLGTV